MFQKRTLNSISSFFLFMAILIRPVPLAQHDSSELPTLANAIDPSISWNTFLGGAGGYDSGFDIFVDGSGNIYVVGTSSPTYIGNPTCGVPIRTYSSGNGDDVFVAKLNSSGTLIWNTFLGGSGSDNASGIVVNQNGNLYVTGSSSANWGTPMQPHDGSASSNGFIAKLDNSGVLIWHTFLGSDYLTGIDLDAAGNIYLTGTTADSLNIPSNPINPHSGSLDAFVVKMTPLGSLSWYTFLGGTAVDRAAEISVGKYGNIYIVGTSYAAWGSPLLPYQTGFWDSFVAKLDPSGTLDWNTFLGAGRDNGSNITVDKNENVYVAGTSSSTWGNPVRAFEHTPPFSTNGFTAKLNSAGTLIYNTFLGNGADESGGIAVDARGYTYVTGNSCSSWGSPFQEAASACTDAFIAKLDSSGNLVANGFLGGSSNDFGGNVFVSGIGDVHMIGVSEGSWGNPVRLFSKDFDSSTVDKDAFVAKLAMPSSFTSGPTDIDVTIAGTSRGLYPMNPDNSQKLQYLLDGGPVEVSSNNGVGIIASLNQWRRNAASPAGWFTGVSQSMALPVELITNQYVMPLYNGTDPTLFNAVLMANVDTVPRTITVTIGGTLMGTYTLDPSESVYGVYDITAGPIVVSSDTGAKIIASLYELKRSQAGVSWNGQSEMMGLPASLLSDQYVLPIYFGAANPSTLDARLYIAVP